MRAPLPTTPAKTPSDQFRHRERAVFIACSLALFFGQGVVFAGLGVALQAMAAEGGWSAGEAGAAFTAMIVAACIAATLPVWSIGRFGGRRTMTAGALLMATGFLVAARAETPALACLATALAGGGFSLLANTPAFTMISGWSGDRAGPRFGLYLTAGALGNAVGPIAAQAATAALGWRGYWYGTAALALLLAAVLHSLLREPPARAANAGAPRQPLRALRSYAYGVMACAMILTQTALMTVFSAAPGHLSTAGWAAGASAAALGAQGMFGAAATAIGGFLLARTGTRAMLIAALAAQAVGLVALALATRPAVTLLFVPAFGLGTALVTLAVTVMLVEHFGRRAGTAGLALIWTLAGAASAGPWAAGLIADATGSYAPALWALAASLLPLTVASALIRRPADPSANAII
ncbi:MFS transporter [Novosphingobium olei]|uniref:MFS transporter n=1 Tax=Novosphingobium olei TaxID=2728851 RepID=A0A7Y0BN24_9SPHN|nr:MFS transporter [Novosphingobium olei]